MSNTPATEIESLTKAYGKLIEANQLNPRVDVNRVHGLPVPTVLARPQR